MDIWIDKSKLQGGQFWEQEIHRAIAAADVSIICLSKKAVAKTGFFQQEIKILVERAREHPEENILLIPVLLEKCDAPDELDSLQWIDYYKKGGYKSLRDRLRAKAAELGRILSTEQQELIDKIRVEKALKQGAAADAVSRDITGTYIVLGNNDDGGIYRGKVTISKKEDAYFMKWLIAGEEFEAQGGMIGNALIVYGNHTVVYKVQSDGVLIGKWGNDNLETLTPVAAEVFSNDVTGTYVAFGENSDGGDYACKVTISREGDSYVVKWFLDGGELESKGSLSGNILMVQGDFGVVYEVRSDKTLLGRWGDNCTETLTPAPLGF